jgi:hypothetical protein
LAYFEHGNIADAASYQTLKENLVAKICSSLTEILERESDKRIAIQYVCAFDDSNCGLPGSELSFPPETVKGRPTRLIDILRGRIAGDHALARFSGRLLLPGRTGGGAGFGACHLPGLVEGFYKELGDEAARAAEEADRSGSSAHPYGSNTR